MNRKQLWVICGLGAALFALFVWPTPYRYEHYGVGGAGLARINRITGSADRVEPQAARTEPIRHEAQAAAPAEKQAEEPLPADEVRKLKVWCEPHDYASGESALCKLYNGTEQEVFRMTVEAKVEGEWRSFEHEFLGGAEARGDSGLFKDRAAPHQTVSLSIDPGVPVRRVAAWRIAGASRQKVQQ